ncbi:TAXI family TRAP transporter solute-binding subunit [Halobacillus sp. A1]|uniref:TAXI family TRAP transporter solute-binding subunit n=1 Tax=Halobacillus sp. A1 TaxID=2880262 RepID=UPI0020A6D54F|nr:TAXI family TRAP transporter solute-binding subunit [Halobacillus sp. A1]MCP3032435.1 TAXI family TRAP transporter solute-binding subunit [Halobacillus sp. A1]
MFSKKGLLTVAMLLALSLVLIACGGGTSDGGGDEGGDGGDEGGGGEEQFLQILTGGTEGTYYPLGGTFAQVINDNLDNVEANATSTGASVENMNAISGGDGEIAFTQTDIASYAAEGEVMFEEANEDFGAIGTLYPETIQIVTTMDSGIETVEDLEGKTVSVGAPGSGTNANADNILDVHGLNIDEDIEARDLDFGDSTTGIQDGTIDAAFITSGTPTGAVESLAASVDVNIVSISAEKAQELMDEFSYYSEDEVPDGTYGLEEAVPTVAVQAMLVAHSDLSEDMVYEMTKAIFENTDQISHDKGEEIDAESALEGVGVDLHPGAQKYFDEEGISEE